MVQFITAAEKGGSPRPRRRWCRAAVLALIGAALLLSSPAPAGDAEKPDLPADPAKWPKDMTQADVRRVLGPPKHIARQILYRRYLEQWVYDGPNSVRIEFDCVRGKEPQILTVHPLTPAPP